MAAHRFVWPSARHYESVRGLVLRFGKQNGFASMKSLAALVSQRTSLTVSSSTDIAQSAEALRAMADMSGLAGADFDSMAWTRHPSTGEDHLRFQGVVLPSDALLMDRLQVCPGCLAKEAYIKADWDLSHVVACPEHECLLVDACTSCGSAISTDRAFTGYCAECGAAFGRVAAPRASASTLAASEDAAGLAPIAFTRGPLRQIAHSATFFELCRLLACSSTAMWSNKVRKVKFALLSVRDRAQVLDEVGGYRGPTGYSAERLRAGLAERFAHLTPFDAFGAREQRLSQLFRSSALPPDLRNFILYGDERGEATHSAAILEGRTTGYTTPRQVARLLGITPEGVAWLKRRGKLTDPLDELGYSTYEILTCHAVLDSLVPCDRFDAALGVMGVASELARHGLVELWNLTPRHQPGLTLSSVTDLLDALRVATCGTAQAGDTGGRPGPSAGEQRPALPPHVYGRVVVALLNGTLSASGWRAPWRLQDIGLADSAISRLSL